MLTVTADDWGLCSEVNDGISHLSGKGIIHQVSVLGNHFCRKDLSKFHEKYPQVKIGAHLNLTDFEPAAGFFKVPSLCDPKTQKFFGGKHWRVLLNIVLLKFSKKDIYMEWQAQIDQIRLAGVPVHFVNSHGHLHLLPCLHDCLLRICRNNNIQHIRLIKSGGGLKAIVLSMFSKILSRKIGQIINPQNNCYYTIGVEKHGQLNIQFTKKQLFELKKKNRDVCAELIVHPAKGVNIIHQAWGYHTTAEWDTLNEGGVVKAICELR